MLQVREAKPEDIADIFFLLKEMHGETPLLPIDEAKVLTTINELLATGIVLVAERDGRIIGTTAAGRRTWWFSDKEVLGDYWTFVRKPNRRSKAAVLLIRELKRQAEIADLPLMMGVFTFDQVKRKNRLFRRHFLAVGETFVAGLERAGD
jgi:N-acetylglutamate synthase-like GNAT family acetyltransferase